MNEYIAKYLKDKINETGITYRNVSKRPVSSTSA